MQTQFSTNESPFSPFFGSALKFETPTVDPPNGGGGTESGTPTPPPPDEEEEEPPQ